MPKRKTYSDAEKRILFNEVDGRCPICGTTISYEKENNIHFDFELAHIYPLNPSPKELNLLNGQKKLSTDVNDIKNILAVCRSCHKRFDHPRTLKEYQEWLVLKERLLTKTKLKSRYAEFGVESDISKVITELIQNPSIEITELNYNAKALSEKADKSLEPLVKRAISHDIADYFEFIQQRFSLIDSESPNTFNLIASQIKTFYLACLKETSNQTEIFYFLVEWLEEKNNYLTRRACEIVISFFIQDCEVFS